MTVALSAWWLLVLALPVLLAGETLLRRFPVLARCNIPASVAGGLLGALLVLVFQASGMLHITWQTKVTAAWWTWLATPEPEWFTRPAKAINLPLLVGFFTCVGLAAPVSILRTGGRALVILLCAATLMAVLQNVLGVALARALGAPPLLGVVCGSLTLVGGHGTVLGFASRFEEAGFASAATVGAAAATFGLVSSGLLAGPLAEWLLRKNHGTASPVVSITSNPETNLVRRGLLADVRDFLADRKAALTHVLVVAVCIKAGAWVSFALNAMGAVFPAYMGALLTGLALRAAHDTVGATWLRGTTLARLGGLFLALFLVVTLTALNLAELATVAGPMLIILTANIAASLAFAGLIVWPLLGRDHEAAVMVAGLVGFGVGSTATAVASMDAIVRRRGPAPRAQAIVPATGGFLIDLTNAPTTTAFLQWLR
ncbi:MAG: sodium/glutamate symporter [Opitutaceae bacterium]